MCTKLQVYNTNTFMFCFSFHSTLVKYVAINISHSMLLTVE